MKRSFSKLAIVLSLVLMQAPNAFSQDKKKDKKEQTKKETNTDDMDTEGDVPAEEETTVAARKDFGPRVGLGLESGVGVSVLEMGTTNTHVNISATMGAYADIRMGCKFYVQPGLFYTLNGGSEVTFDRVTTYPHGVIINMIEMPLTFAYKTGMPGSKVRFTVGVGGYIGFNAGAAINSIDLSIGDASSDDIKPVDVGVALNLGVELRNGLFFRIKSQRGLTDLQPDPSRAAIYTQTHVATIGFLINKQTTRHRPGKSEREEARRSNRM